MALSLRHFACRALCVGLLFAAAPAWSGPVADAGLAWSGSANPESCLHDARAEELVRREIGRRMRRYVEQGQRVTVSFDCQPHALPWSLAALRTHGHAGGMTLLSVEAADDHTIVVRAARTVRQPAELGKPAALVFGHASLIGSRAQAALATARAALAAHVTVADAPASGGVISSSVVMSDDDEDLELETMDAAGPRQRHWDGYVGSRTERDRAPVELAWAAFSSALPARFAAEGPNPLDRRSFARLWPADHPRRPWVHLELLSMAATLAVPEMARDIARDLDAPQPDLRILAVNALAVATGRDLRRDAAGALRPLDAVVADYKATLRPH
ncbi:MAG: hypothetical protein ACJ8F1_14880 [Polyangia bacterium]